MCPVLESSHQTCLGPETGGGRLIPVFLKEEAFAQEGAPPRGSQGWVAGLGTDTRVLQAAVNSHSVTLPRVGVRFFSSSDGNHCASQLG